MKKWRIHFLEKQSDIENQIKFEESYLENKNQFFEPERKSFRGRLLTVNKSLNLNKSINISKYMGISYERDSMTDEIHYLNQSSKVTQYSPTIKKFPIKKHKKIKRIVYKFNFIYINKKYPFGKNKKKREIVFELDENKLFSRNSHKILIKKFMFLKNYIGKKYYNMINFKNDYNTLTFIYKQYSFIQDKIIKEDLYNYSICNRFKILKLQLLSNLKKIKYIIEKEYREIETINPHNSLNLENFNFFQTATKGRYDNFYEEFLTKSIDTLNNLLLSKKPSIINNNLTNRQLKCNETLIINHQESNNLRAKTSNSSVNYNENNLIVRTISEHIGSNSINHEDKILGIEFNPKKDMSSEEIILLKRDNQILQSKGERYSSKEKIFGKEMNERKLSDYEINNKLEIHKQRNSTLISKKQSENIIGQNSKIEEENWDEINSLMDIKLKNLESRKNISFSGNNSAIEKFKEHNEYSNEENEESQESQESIGLGIENIINNYNEQLYNIKAVKNEDVKSSNDSSDDKNINQTSIKGTYKKELQNITFIDNEEINSFISHQ